MKTEWLVADVTDVGPIDRAERGTCYFGGVCGWACFWPIQDTFLAAEPLCDVGTSS